MKSIRKYLIAVVIIGSMAASLNPLHAQTAVVGNFNSNLSLVQAAAPDSIVQVVADSQGLTLLSPGQVPRTGTFWWILPSSIAVPTPCPPQDYLTAPIYQMGDQWLVDETAGAVPVTPRRFGMQAQTAGSTAISGLDMEADTVMNLILRVQTTAANAQMGMMSRAMGMNDSGGPMPGGGGGGGGGDSTNDFYSDSFHYTPPTNGLFLELTNISGGLAYLNLHNATNQVYEILSKTDLSAAAWNIELELWPTDTNCQPFTIPVLDRTNALFVWAKDWTGVTENGNQTPDWWFWKYFGTVDLSDTNLDSGGFYTHTLLDDYNSQSDPDIIQFSIGAANNYANATPTTVQLNVTGLPYYVAVLVDDTNFNDAVWSTYSSPNVALNLWPQGWHDIWIGLRGHADDASAAVWKWKRLKLDYTPPQLVITSPTNSTVTVPVIQLTGYSPKALASISYDLSNAVAVVTNQPVFITGQNFSTNTWESTTNVFQGFDVALTNGLNVITLHAMDLAGNMTTLTTNIICTGNTNLPGVTLLWPQDGMQISGDSFTIQGQVDDPTASVSVTAVDSSGNTNVINGRTGRDGIFWIENVPLNADTTTLALTLSNAAGDTTTNFSVSQSSVGLSVDAVQAGDTTVNVSIDTDGYTVWVNGVEATDNGDGTWTAQITPICIGGGLVQVTAVPNGGGGYGMANNRSQSMANNNPTPSVHTQATEQPPQGVYLVSSKYQDWVDDFNGYSEGGSSWADDAGGWLEGYSSDGSQTWEDSITWPASPWPEAVPWGILWVTNNGQFSYYTHRPATLSFCYANEKVNETDPVTGSSFSASAQATFEFATGGPLGSTAVRLYQFIGGVTVHHNPTPDLDEVPWSTWPNDETVADGRVSVGNVGNLDANGKVLVLLADNTRVDVTQSVKGQDDYFAPPPTPVEYPLTHLTECAAAGNTNNARTTIGIGELVDFSGMPTNTIWSISGNGTISFTNGSDTTFTASLSPGSATVTATIGNVTIPTLLNVIAPDSIIVNAYSDDPNYWGTQDVHGIWMGAKTDYTVILGPKTVSFNQITMRENAPASLSVTWPNGVTLPVTENAETNGILLTCGSSITDHIAQGLFNRDLLSTNRAYVDFSYNISWKDQYSNSVSGWTDFAPVTVNVEFRGSDKKCEVIYQGIPSLDWQGPYQQSQ